MWILIVLKSGFIFLKCQETFQAKALRFSVPMILTHKYRDWFNLILYISDMIWLSKDPFSSSFLQHGEREI